VTLIRFAIPLHRALLTTLGWATCLLLPLLLSSGDSVSSAADGKEAEKRRVLSITGKIDDPFRVSFFVEYVVSKDTKPCKTYAPLADVWLPSEERFYYDGVNMNGRYSVELPLTEVQPGECEWKAKFIAFSIDTGSPKSNHYSSLISIDDPEGKLVTSITYSCLEIPASPESEAHVFCLGNPSPLLNTVMKDQKSLEVNFTTHPYSGRDDFFQ